MSNVQQQKCVPSSACSYHDQQASRPCAAPQVAAASLTRVERQAAMRSQQKYRLHHSSWNASNLLQTLLYHTPALFLPVLKRALLEPGSCARATAAATAVQCQTVLLLQLPSKNMASSSACDPATPQSGYTSIKLSQWRQTTCSRQNHAYFATR